MDGWDWPRMADTVSDSQREACPTLPGAIPGLAFALASHQISESPGACGRNHEAETVRQSGLVISISDVPLPGIVTPATTSGANQSSPRHFARNAWTDGERLSGLPLCSLHRGINSMKGREMAKRTPGPWEPFIDIEKGSLPGIDYPNGSIILYGQPGESCGIHGATHAERIANAHLIAAAPDMLDALKYFLNAFENDEVDSDTARKARKAIEKATGESD